MVKRSEDIFLDKLSPDIRGLICEAVDACDVGNHAEAHKALKPLVDDKIVAAIYYSSRFSRSHETADEFPIRHIEQLKQACEAGYAPAIHELAIHYDNGDDVERDAHKAAKLFRHAAEKDHPHAQWIYGLDLLRGSNGMQKDVSLGLEYIEKSFAAKFEGALETVAEFYRDRMHGYPVDVEKAKGTLAQIDRGDFLSY